MLLVCYADYFDTLIILIRWLFWYVVYLLCILFDMTFICYVIYLICHLFVMLFIWYVICLSCSIFVMLCVCYAYWCIFFFSLFLLCCETLWYALVNLFVIQLVDVFCGMLVLFMVWSYLTLFLYSIPHFSSYYMNVICKYTNFQNINWWEILMVFWCKFIQKIHNK